MATQLERGGGVEALVARPQKNNFIFLGASLYGSHEQYKLSIVHLANFGAGTDLYLTKISGSATLGQFALPERI